jgi:uncharacterized protein (DUF1684 family)
MTASMSLHTGADITTALCPLIVLLFALVSPLGGCAATGDGKARSPAPAGDADAERANWHARRIGNLSADDGWLTLVGLDFLADGTHRIGNGGSCEFRYANLTAPLIGTFVVDGAQVRFRPDATDVMLDGSPILGEVALVADDVGAPSILRNGSVSITLVRRNGTLALRVRDNASPVRTGFRGIELFPYDPDLVVEGRVFPAASGETVAIANVTGFVEETPIAARIRFTLAGSAREFVATAGAGGRLFVVFGDETNGRETYGGGRFLDLAAPIDGHTTIDFNRATNPPCSFTAFATCPTPPAGNRLPVAIRGGERVTR